MPSGGVYQWGYVKDGLGVSSYQPDDTADAMTTRADQALYRAKSEGRNRVHV
ncbi:GGDEF domain-containing protein [Thiocystis minor]|uniref:GGDEF domain-containing protein n=1 Tax=Thiocystis minor TaxID=61597 RepID=UPI0019146385|nr:diguanylate cyclase [Thiocystis minor]